MTCLNDLGRSFLTIAAALGGASTLGALPNLAGAQDTPQQTDTPAITLQDVPFSSGAKLTIDRIGISYIYIGAWAKSGKGGEEFHVGPQLMIVSPHQGEFRGSIAIHRMECPTSHICPTAPNCTW